MEDKRPTIELNLPDSKAKVVFFAYLRYGDFRLLERRIADTLKVSVVEGEAEMTSDITGGIAFDKQDMAVDLIIKEIVDAEGNVVSNKREFINNLTIADGKLVQDKAEELTRGSQLTVEAKKK